MVWGLNEADSQRITARPKNQVGRVLGSAVSAHATSILPVLLVGTLAVQMRSSLDLSTEQLGLAVTVFYLTAALLSVPGGIMVERWGPSAVMRGCAMLLATACLGIALGAWTWALLLPWLMLAGGAAAVSTPAVNLLLAHGIAQPRLGMAFGIRQSANPLATLLSGLAVPAVALTVGWRWAFVCGAAFALLSAILVPRTVVGATRASTEAAKQRPPSAPLVLLSLGFCLGAAAATSMGTFIVTAGVEIGLDRSDAGLLVALASVVALAVRLAGGSLADRKSSWNHLIVVAGMLTIGAFGYLGLSAAAGGAVGLFVPAAIVALSIGWGWNGLFNFSVVRRYARAEAWATAVTQIGAHAGGIVGPLTFGLVVGSTSFGVAWLLVAAEAVVAAGLMVTGSVLLGRQRRSLGSDRPASTHPVLG